MVCHIRLQQAQLRQGLFHLRVRKGVLFHFNAGDAPVRVELQQRGLALGGGPGQGLVQFRDIGDRLKARAFPRRRVALAGKDSEGSEQVVGTGPRGRNQGGAVEQGQDSQPLGQPRPGTGPAAMARQPQDQRDAEEPGRPQQEGHGVRDDALQEPDGHAQHNQAEDLLDPLQPGAGPGQQGAG